MCLSENSRNPTRPTSFTSTVPWLIRDTCQKADNSDEPGDTGGSVHITCDDILLLMLMVSVFTIRGTHQEKRSWHDRMKEVIRVGIDTWR